MQHLFVSKLKQTKQWAILQFYDDFIVAFSKQTQFRIINQKTLFLLLLLFCRCLPFSSALRQIPTKKIMSFLFKFVLFTQSLFFLLPRAWYCCNRFCEETKTVHWEKISFKGERKLDDNKFWAWKANAICSASVNLFRLLQLASQLICDS